MLPPPALESCLPATRVRAGFSTSRSLGPRFTQRGNVHESTLDAQLLPLSRTRWPLQPTPPRQARTRLRPRCSTAARPATAAAPSTGDKNSRYFYHDVVRVYCGLESNRSRRWKRDLQKCFQELQRPRKDGKKNIFCTTKDRGELFYPVFSHENMQTELFLLSFHCPKRCLKIPQFLFFQKEDGTWEPRKSQSGMQYGKVRQGLPGVIYYATLPDL